MDFIYLSNEEKEAVSNNLLSSKRIKEKVANYNGYVGYMQNGRRYYEGKFEERVLNIYRKAC